MKYTALTLFVIGVATVNAGTVVTHTSGSSNGASNASQLGLVNGLGATTALSAAGSARLIAAQGGLTASGATNQQAQ